MRLGVGGRLLAGFQVAALHLTSPNAIPVALDSVTGFTTE